MAGSVAVIGAGPGGLVAGRWLLSQGFEPTIFEQAPTLGGQWTGLPELSGVWPTMHTNTSGITTAFSDLEPENGLVHPSGRDILAYLHRYAETFGLKSRIRFALGSSSSAETTQNGSSATPERPSVSRKWWWRPAVSSPPPNLAALTFARAAGVEPNLSNWPALRRALLFGPLTPSCFRLEGPDALPEAAARFARDAAAFGAIASNDLTEREQKYWSLVQDAMADELTPDQPSS
jgi:hypothetical protein